MSSSNTSASVGEEDMEREDSESYGSESDSSGDEVQGAAAAVTGSDNMMAVDQPVVPQADQEAGQDATGTKRRRRRNAPFEDSDKRRAVFVRDVGNKVRAALNGAYQRAGVESIVVMYDSVTG